MAIFGFGLIAFSGVVRSESAPHGERQYQVDEYRVKAAFPYNFARFVEWPPDSFSGPDGPISICILGENSFGGALNDVIRGKIVDDEASWLHGDRRRASACHILFVRPTELRPFGRWPGSRGQGILSGGEAPGFTAGRRRDGRVFRSVPGY